MSKLAFVTGNVEKFMLGEQTCRQAGIELEQVKLDIDEIQSENSEAIALDKAGKAFAILGKPLIITDDSWAIPGLGGFPGPYMKSINHWFKPQDLINLTASLEDRTIILTQIIVYVDSGHTQLFQKDSRGQLLKVAKGNWGQVSQKVITMDGDNGKSIAEIYDSGGEHIYRRPAELWHEFANWYKDYAQS